MFPHIPISLNIIVTWRNEQQKKKENKNDEEKGLCLFYGDGKKKEKIINPSFIKRTSTKVRDTR
jgi:hypothetical protein